MLMLFNERRAQLRQSFVCMRGYDQLIWISPPIMGNSDCFSTPDQLRATGPEALPSPECVLGRIAVRRSIPAFHWVDCDPVANRDVIAQQRLGQRGLRTRDKLAIAWNLESAGI